MVTDNEGRWQQVERVIDTVELLYRRRQIDQRQRQAATTYRDAVEAAGAGLRSALASDGVRHRHKPEGPAAYQLQGAEVLADAARILGHVDGALVYAVAAEGRTIEEVAKMRFGPGPSGKAREADAKHVGRRLREALAALADVWWPERRPRILGARTELTEAPELCPGEVTRGRVVHATARKIYESGG